MIERELQELTGARSVMVDFVTLRTPPVTSIKTRVNDRQVKLFEVPILKKWYEKQPFEQWKMFVFCEPQEMEAVREACEKIFSPLEIGRENEKKKVIGPLRNLYDQLDSSESVQVMQRSVRSKIIDLPKHEFLTLKTLVAIGPTTSDKVSKQTGRGRSTESLILNRLVENEFAVKERHSRKVYFKSTTATITALKELGGITGTA